MTPNPLLLIEVLSPGNANDTYENVRAYATLPTVREIVIVHSTRVRIEMLKRDTIGDWPDNPDTVEADGTVTLASIGAAFPIAEIYAATHLAGR